METITHLPSWQWNRSVCPSPLAIAHTRPSRSNQPQREQAWHFKDKAKVPAQRKHSESWGINPSWCSRYIKSEASIWHSVPTGRIHGSGNQLKGNSSLHHYIMNAFVLWFLSETSMMTKGSAPSGIKVWIAPSKGKPPIGTCWDDSWGWWEFRMDRSGGWVPDVALRPAAVTGAYSGLSLRDNLPLLSLCWVEK